MSDAMICNDCRHWTYEIKHRNGFRYGECGAEPVDYDHMRADDMLGTEDEKVITGEKFFCVNWAPKGQQ